jgi:L-fuculose-phosphate aldolase
MAHEHPGLDKKISELIGVGKDAVDRGLVLASAGNISCRVNENEFMVTGSGTWFDKLTPESFAHMTLDGEVLSGPKPSSEWKLHQRAYQQRPDAECVIHMHPHTATLLASLNIPVRLITLDHGVYLGSIGISEFYPNGSDDLADYAAAELRNHNCVIMKHHGCSVIADNIDMAYRRALNLESAAQMSYQALLLGDKTTVFPDLDNAAHA